MAFEGLMRRVHEMRENRAVAGTPAEDVVVTKPTAEGLATKEGTSRIDALKARFKKKHRATDEELSGVADVARESIESNNILSAAAARVEKHDQQAETARQAMEVAVTAGDAVKARMIALTSPNLDYTKLTPEALRTLADQNQDGQVDLAELERLQISKNAEAARAELERRATLGELPKLPIEAERVHLEQAERAQAEMLVYGKRVTQTVETFGSAKNESHRVLGQVDEITAANVLLKQEGPTVVLLRNAEASYVAHLQKVAQLQAGRENNAEDQQENLEQSVYQHTEARREIRELAGKAQPNEIYGKRCVFALLDPTPRLGPDAITNEQFSTLSTDGKASVIAHFGEISGDNDRQVLKPVEGSRAAQLADYYAHLGSLQEVRKQAVEICRENPEAADALYLVALQEATLAQKIATQVVTLRTEAKLVIAEQQKKAKKLAAEQANELQKANRAREKAQSYANLRVKALGKFDGGLKRIGHQINKARNRVSDKQSELYEERGDRFIDSDIVLTQALRKILDLFDKGGLTEDTLLSIVTPMGYSSVEDVRNRLKTVQSSD